MLRNVGSTWVLTLLNIPAVYVLTPFIIHTLGQQGYGTWALINSITGYMTLLALGVPMASVRYLAQHVAETDSRKVNEAIASCAGLYLVLGAVALLVGAALMVWFVSTYEIPPALQAQARLAFALMVFQAAAGFIGLLPEGILYAHHDFVIRNLVRLGGIFLRLGLTIGLLKLDASLVVMASIQLALLAFDFSASWLLIRRRYPGVRLDLADFDWRMVRRILSFSVYVLLLNAGARLMFETDALVIGAFLNVESIPFYVVANTFVIYLMDFIVAIAAVVSPMATKLKTEENLPQLREIFLTWSKVALSLSIMAGLFLIVFGPRLVGWWIGPSFERPAGEVLQILMLSSLVFLPVRGVALPVLVGVGKPAIPAFALVTAGLLNLGLSIFLARPLGLVGVALGTAIPNVLFAVFVLVVACRELEIGLSTYVSYVVSRATLGALPPLAVLLWFKLGLEVQAFAGLVAAGLAMTALFAVTWVFFVYRGDPYVDLWTHLMRFRVWSRARA
jgi:O-antigen/teichoic acid export membrane protein